MTYAFQFQGQTHGNWQTVATFPSVKAAETAIDEFGLLLTERYDETRIIGSALA
jgi:hypothetical protein